MKLRKCFSLLLVSFFTMTIMAESQEINDQLKLAARLPYGEVQLNIISDILNPSSGASTKQRQLAEEFKIYKDRQIIHNR